MGWCSATAIMDTALKAAEAAVGHVLDSGAGARLDVERCTDEALRPFVATIADILHNGDWDCVEEAEHFRRFPQEMLGYDDARYGDWLAENIREWVGENDEEYRFYSDLLHKHNERLKADGTG